MADTTTADIDRLARLAATAAPQAASASDATRATWLRSIAVAIDAASEELVATAARETHLGEPRLVGELARTTAQLRLFSDVVEEGSYLEATIDHPNPAAAPPIPDLRRLLHPIGPVAVFAASNFPFAFSVAGGDTASALAVGCPVLVKAHPGHPATSELMASIVAAALKSSGAPEGLFAIVFGFAAGLALVDHPLTQAVAFTGSVPGGRALLDRCAARSQPIPFYGELGSLNPVVITATADRLRGASIAAGLAGSFQLGAGQFCTKPGVVFVPPHSRLEAELGAHLVPQPRMLTEQIFENYADAADRLAGIPGVRVVESVGSDDSRTAPRALSVDADVFQDNAQQLTEEVFGPFTILVSYRDEAELLACLRILPGSLTATLHHEPEEQIASLATELAARAGRLVFGGWPTGVAVSWAQHHGGPWPSTNTQFTSVGASAVRRFQRPVAYQDAPAAALPLALREENPLGITRRVDGEITLP